MDREIKFWRQILPAFAERVVDRSWEHDLRVCKYTNADIIPNEVESICDCGRGKVSREFLEVEEWRPFARDVQRIALSPLFFAPCDPVAGKQEVKGVTDELRDLHVAPATKTEKPVEPVKKEQNAIKSGENGTKTMQNWTNPKENGVKAGERNGNGHAEQPVQAPPVAGNGFSEKDPKCNLCQQGAAKKCARCESVAYCSRECQAKDWKLHKRSCIKITA